MATSPGAAWSGYIQCLYASAVRSSWIASAKISERHPARRSTLRSRSVCVPVASCGFNAGTNWCTATGAPCGPAAALIARRVGTA